ncbi:hypothetical protein [Leifsonia sp. LS-T14]|uniref:hypothetical protein n=1 Tax=unclassified Leifsonia TaxID=2663824 RepID=UPI0035A73F80
MNDEPESVPDPRLLAWVRAFNDPEVERVDLMGSVVCVRLRSGVELEWPLEAVEEGI